MEWTGPGNVDSYSDSGSLGMGSIASDVGNLLELDQEEPMGEILWDHELILFPDDNEGQSAPPPEAYIIILLELLLSIPPPAAPPLPEFASLYIRAGGPPRADTRGRGATRAPIPRWRRGGRTQTSPAPALPVTGQIEANKG